MRLNSMEMRMREIVLVVTSICLHCGPRRLACAARNAYSHSDERVQSQVAASRRIVGQHPPNSKHHGGALDKAGKVFI